MVAVDALMEGADETKRADLQALIDGREPPSIARARAEQAQREEQEKETKRAQVASAQLAAKRLGRHARR